MSADSPAQSQTGPVLQVVSFRLANETYALDILLVQEIIKSLPVTQVPMTVPWIAGVINLRGQILPLIDLRQRVGLEPQPYTGRTRFIITRFQGHSIGLVVDAVAEVLRLSPESLIPIPATHIDKDYIRHVSKTGRGLVNILDLDKILQLNFEQLQEQESQSA